MTANITQCANLAQAAFARRGMDAVCAERKMPGMRGNRLKEIRNSNGLAQRVLADRMGISIPQISRWETGEDSIPSHRLAALAEAYECTIGEIFEEPVLSISEDELASILERVQRDLPVPFTLGEWPRFAANRALTEFERIRAERLKALRGASSGEDSDIHKKRG